MFSTPVLGRSLLKPEKKPKTKFLASLGNYLTKNASSLQTTANHSLNNSTIVSTFISPNHSRNQSISRIPLLPDQTGSFSIDPIQKSKISSYNATPNSFTFLKPSLEYSLPEQNKEILNKRLSVLLDDTGFVSD
jgi:hypothetical protein